MCLIALAKPGAIVAEKVIRHASSWNRDGMGIAYINPKNKKVVIDKAYKSVEGFLEAYERMLKEGIGDFAHALHFRFATVGGAGMENCQPFAVKGGAMLHNGTFFGRGQHMGGKSDTRIVAERMYNNFAHPIVSRNFKEFETALGYSRVVFLYDGGHYFITNEKSHDCGWEDDVWYSNGGYKIRYNKPAPTGEGSSYTGSGSHDGHRYTNHTGYRKYGNT